MKFLITVFLMGLFLATFINVQNVWAPTLAPYAEDLISFTKSDWGEGLSTRECMERGQLISAYFEPNMDLATLKAEHHSSFKTLVENKPYRLDSSGGTTVRFSDHCDSDIPAFQLQYMTDETDESHTRIYVSMDYVSYDVLEISSRFVEGNYPDPMKPQQLPFYIKNWEEIQIVGEYTNSAVPSKFFKIPFVVTGGQVNNIEGNMDAITVELASNGEGKFALKIPRNYPHILIMMTGIIQDTDWKFSQYRTNLKYMLMLQSLTVSMMSGFRFLEI